MLEMEEPTTEAKTKRVRKSITILETDYTKDPNTLEIGVDEAGRGPLFGRVYAAAVILPKQDATFDYGILKDSKKFSSPKKRKEVAEYIQQHALAWSISYEDEETIDEINILQATQKSMHSCISETQQKIQNENNHVNSKLHLLIDGNYFQPISHYNKTRKAIEVLPYSCIEGGDNKFACIAAASILAKTARDDYMEELCDQHPDLDEKYGLRSNKGYGAKKHRDGIQTFGITKWHRKTFGICKSYA